MLILADDLSGAADCGVACVGAGLETLVVLRYSVADVVADVLALDADTRRMPAEEAAREVGRLLENYGANPELRLFKKIDSTLRGNVGAELVAALNALREQQGNSRHCMAIMAPAFPAIGRTTRGGIQYVHGQPLHELDIWRAQGMTGDAHIAEMLKCAGLQCTVIGLDTIRAPQDVLAERMDSAAKQADVLVCDAETDDDLFAIASASTKLVSRPLWVGSAGLAYQLPSAAGIARRASAVPVSLAPVKSPPLFVIGSLSRNSLEQVRQLASQSGTRAVCMPPEVLLTGEQHVDWRRYAEELEAAIKSNNDVVISPETEPRIDLHQRPHIAAGLARMAATVSADIGALIASGGETARAVLSELGIDRLRLLGELEKGVPVSITENWNRSLPVITKAGDFGGADALLKCSHFLRSEALPVQSPQLAGKANQ